MDAEQIEARRLDSVYPVAEVDDVEVVLEDLILRELALEEARDAELDQLPSQVRRRCRRRRYRLKRADPSRLLLLTFTRRAALEMTRRAQQILVASQRDRAAGGPEAAVDPAGMSLQLTPYNNTSLIRPPNADDLSHQAAPNLPRA